MKLKCLSVFLVFSMLGNAQDVDSISNQNMRLMHKNHVGVVLGGPGFLGYYYEHYFNQNWSIEIGLGSVLVLAGAYAEGRYYFGRKENPHMISPYVGVGGGAAMILDLDYSYGAAMIYAPVGLQIFSKKGFAFSFEVAYFNLDNESFPMGALKFRLMKKNKMKRKK